MPSFIINDFSNVPLAKTGSQFASFKGKIDANAGAPLIMRNTSLAACFSDVTIPNADF